MIACNRHLGKKLALNLHKPSEIFMAIFPNDAATLRAAHAEMVNNLLPEICRCPDCLRVTKISVRNRLACPVRPKGTLP